MKTLKQIREEYKEKYVSQVEHLPEEVMLEKNVIPSTKEMPSLIIFRRVSFRSYPKGQVVALYYSKTMDKYLSVPIGPGHNVNLSEATEVTVSETLGSSATRYTERPTYEHFKDKLSAIRKSNVDEGLADVADTAADVLVPYYSAGKKAFKGDWKGAAKSAAVDTALMAMGGPLTRTAAKGLKLGGKAIMKGAEKLGLKSAAKTGEKAVAKDAAVAAKSEKSGKGLKGAAVGAAAGAAAAGVKQAVDSASDASKQIQSGIEGRAATGQLQKGRTSAKVSSSWQKRPEESPIYKEKARQAYLKSVSENKITDIRTMVKEGVENMDLSINGRQVTLNTSMAKRILEVYDSVNTKNKKIVEGMLNEDLESFKKLLNFSIRN